MSEATPQAGPSDERSFVLRWHRTEAQIAGARWWNESLERFRREQRAAGRPMSDARRKFISGALKLGGVVLVVAAIRNCVSDDDDDAGVDYDSLDLQKTQGWNVGEKSALLSFGFPSSVDADGGVPRRERILELASLLQPTTPQYLPFYVPTLFSSLVDPRAATLRDQMVAENPPVAQQAYDRALAIADLFKKPDAPTATAVIIDLPGASTVAVAAALSSVLDPIFLFDNWPHSQGVVPSHRLISAALFQLPRFQRAAEVRAVALTDFLSPRIYPPLFVLDSLRLSPYRDDINRFDNRYLARLPSADALKKLGYTRVLYVRPSNSELQELDDLNDDFVRYHDAGIDVRAVSLADFTLDPTQPATLARYHYGGSPVYHSYFWHSYGWSSGRVYSPAPARPFVSPGVAYRPSYRPTIFSSRSTGGLMGVGRQKPSGFGRVSVRMNPTSHTVSDYGRSGSFGRSRSSWSG